MISRTKWLAALGTAAAMALGASAAMAGTVVAVTGPSAGEYPVGTQIGDTQRVTLKSGDRLTVLDSGGTRVFSGPGTIVLARPGRTATNSAFNALTRQRQERRGRVASSRTGDTGTGPTRPNLWYVDVTASGKVCLSDPTAVRLWRANTDADEVYTIAAVANPASSVDLTFGEGEMLAGWDSRLALTEGLIYSVAKTGSEEKVNIDFVILDEVPDDPEALTMKLIENGCMSQVEVLANDPQLRS